MRCSAEISRSETLAPFFEIKAMRSFGFLAFVALTFCCWGIYGPVLHIGQEDMGGGAGKATLRPLICVGMAYFLIAVVYPLIVLYSKGEKGNWSASGAIWSFVAGAVGAIGALGIILAFKFQGKPVYVMPLVFGLAPIVNTLVTMGMSGTFKQASIRFYLGILIVAFGAAGVLRFKPTVAKPEAAKAAMSSPLQVGQETGMTQVSLKQDAGSEQEPAAKEDSADELEGAASETADSEQAVTTPAPEKAPIQPLAIAVCIGITALSWGAYGPVLHKGQAKMGGSRLRPFLCVGWAYFAIAVIVPWILLGSFPDPGGFSNTSGVLWSLAAGAAGAIGALGIIYAFNFGGKPVFVMPLVFGFAPVINTLTETISKNLLGSVSGYFMASLAMVIVGAVMVLVFAPRGPAPKPA